MVLERFRVDGRVALVTGAGRGIGRGAALALAEAGADVVLVARTAEQLDAVAAEVESLGRRATTLPLDVMEIDRLGEAVELARNTFGRLDILVNNAGGSFPKPFPDTSPRSFDVSFRFNVTTAFELTRAATPLLLRDGGGTVVNISSTVGRLADRGFAAYGTAKAALSHLTRVLAADLAPHIRVNGIEVGSTATSALEAVLGDEGIRTAMEQATPLRRLGTVEDIAAAVIYLASPASAYMTGALLPVDGGLRGPSLPLGIPDLEPDED